MLERLEHLRSNRHILYIVHTLARPVHAQVW